MEVEFTKLSSKGQVVIPSDIRKKMKLKEGAPFAVISSRNDTILLKKIKMPSLEDFERLTKRTTEIAKKNKLKPEDIERIIHKHRGVE